MKQNLTPRLNRQESNILIDAGMEIWPEGTSRSIANNTGAYGAVLFQYNNVSSGLTMTNQRSSSIPSGTNIPFSNQTSKPASVGTLAAGTRQIMHYHIEGNDLQRIWNNEFTLIFWVKSSVASNRSVSLRNASVSHSYVQQYNIAVANAWELKAIRFPAMSTCPGTVNRDSALGAIVSWDIVTGSTFQTSSLDQWVAANKSSGIGEDTSWLTSGLAQNFSIAGAMILPGDWSDLTASGYNFIRAGKDFNDEVSKSQRYYEKSYNLDVTPATNTSVGMHFVSATIIGNYVASFPWASEKRIAPAVFLYDRAGTLGRLTNISGTATYTDNIVNSPGTTTGPSTRMFSQTVGPQTAPGTGTGFHWTADARF